MKTIISLMACGLLWCGCSRSNGPSVNLVTVHFKEATALETTTEFVLRLGNESPEAKKFTGSTHKIYINGLYVGKGLSDQAIEVPRLGTVTQAVTVHLSNLALATRIKAIIESKRFDYRVQSTFFGDSWLSRAGSETMGQLDWKDFTPTETNERPAPAHPPAPAGEPPAQPPPPATQPGREAA